MRRDVARHRSYSDHYGALAHCALCQSPSALKLIDSVFICEWCLLGRDSVGYLGLGGRIGVGRTAFSPAPRGIPKSSQLTLFGYNLSPSDPLSTEGES